MAFKIRWDDRQDHHLLSTILKTHPSLKVDVDSVAAAWTSDPHAQHPTPRAIRERLTLIRKRAGEAPVKVLEQSQAVEPTARPRQNKHSAGNHVQNANNNVSNKDYKRSNVGSHLTPPPTDRTHRFAFPEPQITAGTPANCKNSTVGKQAGASKPSRRPVITPTHSRKRRAPESSDEEELTSANDTDSDSLPELSTLIKGRACVGAKMSLRTKRRLSYNQYDKDNNVVVDSDESDYDPIAEREKLEKRARRRPRTWGLGTASSEM